MRRKRRGRRNGRWESGEEEVKKGDDEVGGKFHEGGEGIREG